MSRILSLYKKEIHHLFDGILAYLCMFVFLLFVGGFSLFFQDILQQATTSLQPLFFWSAIGFLFLVPALSMASFSDENRTGSIEILMTLPLRNEDIVIGKYMFFLICKYAHPSFYEQNILILIYHISLQDTSEPRI